MFFKFDSSSIFAALIESNSNESAVAFSVITLNSLDTDVFKRDSSSNIASNFALSFFNVWISLSNSNECFSMDCFIFISLLMLSLHFVNSFCNSFFSISNFSIHSLDFFASICSFCISPWCELDWLDKVSSSLASYSFCTCCLASTVIFSISISCEDTISCFICSISFFQASLQSFFVNSAI